MDRVTREHLRLPAHTTYVMGASVGRFCAAVILALLPDHPAFVIEEIPNYHYVGDGEIELAGMTTVEWGELVVRMWRFHAGLRPAATWVDADTDFLAELKRCKLRLMRNPKGPELRTEITREYFHENKLLFAPWLSILPNEISRARWPPEESSAYHVRAKGQDYCLNALEQVVSRRPVASEAATKTTLTWMQRYYKENSIVTTKRDPHLGPH